MTRASLGHTGRELRADHWTNLIYLAIVVAAVLRVVAPLGIGDPATMIGLSGATWIAAFGLFAVAYGTKLFAPRLDGKP
jgi:uncharacterized protein involved in response to NO